jgi:hypothetical protein
MNGIFVVQPILERQNKSEFFFDLLITYEKFSIQINHLFQLLKIVLVFIILSLVLIRLDIYDI